MSVTPASRPTRATEHGPTGSTNPYQHQCHTHAPNHKDSRILWPKRQSHYHSHRFHCQCGQMRNLQCLEQHHHVLQFLPLFTWISWQMAHYHCQTDASHTGTKNIYQNQTTFQMSIQNCVRWQTDCGWPCQITTQARRGTSHFLI